MIDGWGTTRPIFFLQQTCLNLFFQFAAFFPNFHAFPKFPSGFNFIFLDILEHYTSYNKSYNNIFITREFGV